MRVPLEIAADNDVVLKCACYELLDDLVGQVQSPEAIGILGVARYVVRDYLERRPDIRNGQSAVARLDEFVAAVTQLEPIEEEVELATAIEEAALDANVPLDTGESQLCSMVVIRGIEILVTGDKRAIRGLEVLVLSMGELARIQARVACLEQLIFTIASQIGGASARARICAEPEVDGALSICFECTRQDDLPAFEPVGLRSYIDDLRSDAPSILLNGYEFAN